MSYIKQADSGGGDTYTLKAAQAGADVDIQLDAATGTDSDVKLKAGTNITLTEASDTVTIDSAGAGGSIGVNQVAFGDPSSAGDIKGSNNFTFVDESGAVGADVKISGDRPTFTLEDDTGATDYKSIFRQSGASGYWVHADSTGVDKQMIRVAAADIIINELANDVDVRIEGDAVDNLFRTSATQNNVGVGGQPGANVQRLHVVGDSNNTSTTDAVVKIQNTVSGQTFTALELSNENDDANSDVTMRMRSNSGTDSDFEIVHDSFGGTTFLTNQPNTGTTAQMKIAMGDVNINPNQADVDMIVEGSSDASLLRTDAALDKVGIGTTPAAFRSKLTVNAGTDRNALDLISSDASSDGGPNVRLYRDSGSPAPGDIIGTLRFIGKDDGGSDTEYARISGLVSDETGATEDGWLQFGAAFAGNIQPNMMTIRGDVPEIVVNEGSADVNFRVESNANANMFKVDAGSDIVTVGSTPTGTASANGTLQVRNKTISSYVYLGFSNTGVTTEELNNDRMQSQMIVHKGAADHTYELPTGIQGMYFKFVSTGGNITIQPDSGDTINGGAAGASVTRTTDNQIYECLCHTANTWIVSNP